MLSGTTFELDLRLRLRLGLLPLLCCWLVGRRVLGDVGVWGGKLGWIGLLRELRRFYPLSFGVWGKGWFLNRSQIGV